MAHPGQPPSFRTNVHRAPTKKWADAKQYDYGGDEWGDDEYGTYDEPPPLPKPTGLRQKGQHLPSSSQGSNDQAVSIPSNHRSNSFDAEDEQRNFSAISEGSQAAPFRVPDEQYRMPEEQSRPSEDPYRSQAGPSQQAFKTVPFAESRSMQPPPVPSPAMQQQNFGERAPQSQGTMMSPTHDYRRREFSNPSAVPLPLSPRMVPDQQPVLSTENAKRTSFPPRKSSLSQSNPPDLSFISQSQPMQSVNNQDSVPTERSAQSTPTIPQYKSPFIRPADIYKRMEEEREKERQSIEARRSSAESGERVPRNNLTTTQSGSTRIDSVSPARLQSSQHAEEQNVAETDPVPSSTVPPQPIAERQNDYELQGFAVSDPVLARAIGANFSQSPPPSLPQVNRVSVFESDMFNFGSPSKTTRHAEEFPTRQANYSTRTSGMPGQETVLRSGQSAPYGQAAYEQNTPSTSGNKVQMSSAGLGIHSPYDSEAPHVNREDEKIQPQAEDLNQPRHTSSSEDLNASDSTRNSISVDVPVSHSRTFATEAITPTTAIEPVNKSTDFATNSQSNNSTPLFAEDPIRQPEDRSGQSLPHFQEHYQPSFTAPSAASLTETEDPEISRSSYATREADVADDVNSNTEVVSPPLLNAMQQEKENSVRARFESNAATANFGEALKIEPPNRADSPSKGKVRTLANRFDELATSASSTPASPTGSMSSWKAPGAPPSTRGTLDVGYDGQDDSARASGYFPAPQARPHLPGEWISYADSYASDPRTPGRSYAEDDEEDVETPRAIEEQTQTHGQHLDEPDFSPTTGPRSTDSRSLDAEVEDPMVALKHAGTAIAESLRAAMGLAHHDQPEHAVDEQTSDQHIENPIAAIQHVGTVIMESMSTAMGFTHHDETEYATQNTAEMDTEVAESGNTGGRDLPDFDQGLDAHAYSTSSDRPDQASSTFDEFDHESAKATFSAETSERATPVAMKNEVISDHPHDADTENRLSGELPQHHFAVAEEEFGVRPEERNVEAQDAEEIDVGGMNAQMQDTNARDTEAEAEDRFAERQNANAESDNEPEMSEQPMTLPQQSHASHSPDRDIARLSEYGSLGSADATESGNKSAEMRPIQSEDQETSQERADQTYRPFPQSSWLTGLRSRPSGDVETENDRLSRDIVRSLTPANEAPKHQSVQSFSAPQGPHSSVSEKFFASRESTVLPREYDSYWAEKRDEQDFEDAQPTGHDSAAVSPPESKITADSEHVASPSTAIDRSFNNVSHTSSVPGLLGKRFSWERNRDSHAVAPAFDLSESSEQSALAAQASSIVNLPTGTAESAGLTTMQSQNSASPVASGMPAREWGPRMTGPVSDNQNHTQQTSEPIFSAQGQAVANDTFGTSRNLPTQAGLANEVSEDEDVNNQTRDTRGGSISETEPMPTQQTTNVASNRSSTQLAAPKLLPFKDIQAIEQSQDRVNAYVKTREEFANMQTGLNDWLSFMVSAQPDVAQNDPPQFRPAIAGGFTGSVLHKISPSVSKFTKSAIGAISPDSTTRTGYSSGEMAAGHDMEDRSRFRTPSGSMHSKGKDSLQGDSGGKGSFSMKGLLAKGKSRFRGGSSDKTQSAPPTFSAQGLLQRIQPRSRPTSLVMSDEERTPSLSSVATPIPRQFEEPAVHVGSALGDKTSIPAGYGAAQIAPSMPVLPNEPLTSTKPAFSEENVRLRDDEALPEPPQVQNKDLYDSPSRAAGETTAEDHQTGLEVRNARIDENFPFSNESPLSPHVRDMPTSNERTAEEMPPAQIFSPMDELYESPTAGMTLWRPLRRTTDTADSITTTESCATTPGDMTGNFGARGEVLWEASQVTGAPNVFAGSNAFDEELRLRQVLKSQDAEEVSVIDETETTEDLNMPRVQFASLDAEIGAALGSPSDLTRDRDPLSDTQISNNYENDVSDIQPLRPDSDYFRVSPMSRPESEDMTSRWKALPPPPRSDVDRSDDVTPEAPDGVIPLDQQRSLRPSSVPIKEMSSEESSIRPDDSASQRPRGSIQDSIVGIGRQRQSVQSSYHKPSQPVISETEIHPSLRDSVAIDDSISERAVRTENELRQSQQPTGNGHSPVSMRSRFNQFRNPSEMAGSRQSSDRFDAPPSDLSSDQVRNPRLNTTEYEIPGVGPPPELASPDAGRKRRMSPFAMFRSRSRSRGRTADSDPAVHRPPVPRQDGDSARHTQKNQPISPSAEDSNAVPSASPTTRRRRMSSPFRRFRGRSRPQSYVESDNTVPIPTSSRTDDTVKSNMPNGSTPKSPGVGRRRVSSPFRRFVSRSRPQSYAETSNTVHVPSTPRENDTIITDLQSPITPGYQDIHEQNGGLEPRTSHTSAAELAAYPITPLNEYPFTSVNHDSFRGAVTRQQPLDSPIALVGGTDPTPPRSRSQSRARFLRRTTEQQSVDVDATTPSAISPSTEKRRSTWGGLLCFNGDDETGDRLRIQRTRTGSRSRPKSLVVGTPQSFSRPVSQAMFSDSLSNKQSSQAYPYANADAIGTTPIGAPTGEQSRTSTDILTRALQGQSNSEQQEQMTSTDRASHVEYLQNQNIVPRRPAGRTRENSYRAELPGTSDMEHEQQEQHKTHGNATAANLTMSGAPAMSPNVPALNKDEPFNATYGDVDRALIEKQQTVPLITPAPVHPSSTLQENKILSAPPSSYRSVSAQLPLRTEPQTQSGQEENETKQAHNSSMSAGSPLTTDTISDDFPTQPVAMSPIPMSSPSPYLTYRQYLERQQSGSQTRSPVQSGPYNANSRYSLPPTASSDGQQPRDGWKSRVVSEPYQPMTSRPYSIGDIVQSTPQAQRTQSGELSMAQMEQRRQSARSQFGPPSQGSTSSRPISYLMSPTLSQAQQVEMYAASDVASIELRGGHRERDADNTTQYKDEPTGAGQNDRFSQYTSVSQAENNWDAAQRRQPGRAVSTKGLMVGRRFRDAAAEEDEKVVMSPTSYPGDEWKPLGLERE